MTQAKSASAIGFMKDFASAVVKIVQLIVVTTLTLIAEHFAHDKAAAAIFKRSRSVSDQTISYTPSRRIS